MSLYVWSEAYQRLLDDEDGDWELALKQIGESFAVEVGSLAKMVREQEAEATALESEAKRMKDRATAKRNRAQSFKDYVASQMEVMGVSHVPGIVDVRLQASNPSIETGPDLPNIWLKATLKMPLSEVPQHLYEYLSGSADPDKAGLMALHKDGGALPPGAQAITGKQHLVLR
jgi:hypothetical protein